MSCDWDVGCLDCPRDAEGRWPEAGISDANHDVDLMRALVRHADSLALLQHLNEDPSCYDVTLQVCFRTIPLAFFAEHRGHHLIACNEYGELDRPCPATEAGFLCKKCQTRFPCEALDHPRWPHLHRHTLPNIPHVLCGAGEAEPSQ